MAIGTNSSDVPRLSFGPGNAARDLFLERAGAANLRFGAPDAAAPVAQTLSVQNVVAGTNNTAGANLTIVGSIGTGTGTGGAINFQTAPAGSTGTSQNALATAMTILGNGNVGVGTTNPASPFSVNGGISAGSYYGTAAPSNGMIISGNVGIGTTGPLANLDVSGGAGAGTLTVRTTGTTGQSGNTQSYFWFFLEQMVMLRFQLARQPLH